MNYFAMPGIKGIKVDKKKVRFLSPETITSAVCRHFGISNDKIFQKSQHADDVYPRYIALYLIRQYSRFSLTQIAKGLTFQNHTSPIHACKKITGLMKVDVRVRNEVNEIIENM